jgi:HD-like signal output (HDOD) protein
MNQQDPCIQKIQVFIDRMPSLSTTVSKVLEVCNSPKTSANDLNRVISLDPVLTGHVLKLINSAYYSLPNQISSLARAIIMLGLNTVKNLALSTAVIGAIGKKSSFTALPMDAFWTHSIGVGVTAKALAAVRNVPSIEREEYFVAGMLHDLGKIPLNTCFSENYGQALQKVALEQSPLLNAEQLLVGVDHGTAGRFIGEKWRLSSAIIEGLTYHHAPEQVPDEHRDLVATVALANLYANIHKIGSAGDLYPDNAFLARILKMMGLEWDDLQPLQEIVNNEIEKAQVFLNLTEQETK